MKFFNNFAKCLALAILLDYLLIAGLTSAQTNTYNTLDKGQTAGSLQSATTIVSVSAATAPSNGQCLTATSSTTATWQSCAAGGSAWSSLTAPTVSNSVTGTVDVTQTLLDHYDSSATANQSILALGEDVATTKAAGAANAANLLKISTLSGSTAWPLCTYTQAVRNFCINQVGAIAFTGLSDAVTTTGGTGGTFTGGASASANAAGSFTFSAGANSSNGPGGNIIFTPGPSSSGTAGTIQLGGPIADGGNHLFMSNTAPTITSGFGTSPAITANNTAAFKVAIGTTPGTTGVLAMPTASNGWVCDAHDVTTTTETVDLTASSASSVTLTFYGRTTGTATAPTAADVILIKCTAY